MPGIFTPFLIALLANRQQIALGITVGIWLFSELFYGMLMLGATLQFSRATLKVLLLAGLAGNPVDLKRVLSPLAVGGPHLFGPAGATLVKVTESASMAGVLGLGALLLRIVIPLPILIRLFSRQNL